MPFRDMIANISGLEQAIVDLKMALRTANTWLPNLVNFGPQTAKNRTIISTHSKSTFSGAHISGAKGRGPIKISQLVQDDLLGELHQTFPHNVYLQWHKKNPASKFGGPSPLKLVMLANDQRLKWAGTHRFQLLWMFSIWVQPAKILQITTGTIKTFCHPQARVSFCQGVTIWLTA